MAILALFLRAALCRRRRALSAAQLRPAPTRTCSLGAAPHRHRASAQDALENVHVFVLEHLIENARLGFCPLLTDEFVAHLPEKLAAYSVRVEVRLQPVNHGLPLVVSECFHLCLSQ